MGVHQSAWVSVALILFSCACSSKKEIAKAITEDIVENMATTTQHTLDFSKSFADSLALSALKIEYYPSDSNSQNKIKSITHLNIKKGAQHSIATIRSDSSTQNIKSTSKIHKKEEKSRTNHLLSLKGFLFITFLITLLFIIIKYILRL